MSFYLINNNKEKVACAVVLEAAEGAEAPKKDDAAPPRPKRTLTGWKDGEPEKPSDSSDHTVFRNKEKVLVTCSRRINYRYRHLMLNVVSLLPHCKKDSKVESKESKGSTLNELIELRNCSSCLFFEETEGSLSLDG